MNLPQTLLFAMLFLGVAYPLRAYAGPPDQGDTRAQVSKLVDQAEAAGAKGNKQAAYDAYVAAWALQKSFDIAGNAGSLALKLGKLPEAARYLSYAVQSFPPTGDPALLAILKERRAKALQAVGRVRVTLSVPGAVLTIDGAPVAPEETGAELFVSPGTHPLVATAAGYVAARATVEAAAGSSQDVTLTLVPVAPPHRSVVPGAVLGGVAGAALVTGIAVIAVGANKHASDVSLGQAITQAHRSCVVNAANFDPQCSTLESMSSAADTLDRAGVGLLVGAGAAAVGSVAYFLWPQSKPPAPVSGGVRVVPMVSTTVGGVFISGAF